MKPWIPYAVMTLLAWGVWGFFSKLASNHTRPRQTLLFQAVGVMAFALVVLCFERFHVDWSPAGFGWSSAAGLINFVGFSHSSPQWRRARYRQSSRSSLYPVITILLSEPSRAAAHHRDGTIAGGCGSVGDRPLAGT
jgi:transporter family protein